ncbi:MAG: serine/threonine-protein kinase [Planctomycetota bacterium]
MSLHLAGRRIGNVRIDALMAEGAAGVVYRGEHATLGLPVAIKVFKLDLSGEDQVRYLDRFRREAQITARLNHPSIVRVHDYGEIDGRPYIVMDYIDGFPLSDYIKQRTEPVTEATVLKVLMVSAGGLQVAHKAGVIHRDLKPANLMLGRNGKLTIVDMGLAREQGSAGLTHQRIVVGSPAYMAPEAFTPGVPVDHRADLYALGVIGYEMAFGRLPFQGSVEEVMRGHMGGQVRFDLPTVCSRRTIGIIQRLMAYNVDSRYQSAGEAYAAIRGTLLGPAGRTTGSSGSREQLRGSGGRGSDFSGIVRFLDDRVRAETSIRDGGRIVHSTAWERLIVWVLLLGVLGLAIGGLILSRQGTGADARPAAATTEETPDVEAPGPDGHTAAVDRAADWEEPRPD